MRVKGKRVLKNGVTAGYVKQEDGSWRWRFLSGPKKSRKRGGVKNNNIKPIIRKNNIPLAGVNTSGLQHIEPGQSVVSNLPNPTANTRRNNQRANAPANARGNNQRANARANARRNNQRANAPANARRNNQRANAPANVIHQAILSNKMTIPYAFVTDQNISKHLKDRGFFGRLYNSTYAGSNLPNKQHALHGEDFIYTIDNLKRIRTDINKDSRHLKKKRRFKSNE